MCLMLDQFLWGHSSRDCDISCYAILSYALSSFAIILVWNMGIVAYFKYLYDLNLTVIIIELCLILL